VEPIHDRVIEALRGVPGAVECHVFGSRARGTQDAWSDLDLQLVVDDLAVAEACVIPVLAAELDLRFAWRMPLEAWRAWVVLPADASPAHKVDLGVLDRGGMTRRGLGPTQTAWEQSARSRACHDQGTTFSPPIGTTAHTLLGELIGATRYIKARRRGLDAECRKRAHGILRALGTSDEIIETLPRADLDNLVVQGARQLGELARHATPRLPEAVADLMVTFMADALLHVTLPRDDAGQHKLQLTADLRALVEQFVGAGRCVYHDAMERASSP
jgi:predicted nucleotidyltransferase